MNAMNEVPTPAASFDAPDMLTYDARELVKDGTRARIVLDGTPYFLRITRAGKLILTK